MKTVERIIGNKMDTGGRSDMSDPKKAPDLSFCSEL